MLLSAVWKNLLETGMLREKKYLYKIQSFLLFQFFFLLGKKTIRIEM